MRKKWKFLVLFRCSRSSLAFASAISCIALKSWGLPVTIMMIIELQPIVDALHRTQSNRMRYISFRAKARIGGFSLEHIEIVATTPE